jgi:hypothetical protein
MSVKTVFLDCLRLKGKPVIQVGFVYDPEIIKKIKNVPGAVCGNPVFGTMPAKGARPSGGKGRNRQTGYPTLAETQLCYPFAGSWYRTAAYSGNTGAQKQSNY